MSLYVDIRKKLGDFTLETKFEAKVCDRYLRCFRMRKEHDPSLYCRYYETRRGAY